MLDQILVQPQVKGLRLLSGSRQSFLVGDPGLMVAKVESLVEGELQVPTQSRAHSVSEPFEAVRTAQTPRSKHGLL